MSKRDEWPDIITTPKVTLKRWPSSPSPEFLEEFYRLIETNRSFIYLWHNWVPKIKSVEDLREYFADPHGAYTMHDEKGAIIGYFNICGSFNSARAMLGYGLSYWVDHGHTRQGIATSAIRAAEDLLFNLDAGYIKLEVETDNEPSTRLALKLGYTLDHVFSFSPAFLGRACDLGYYIKTWTDWKQSPPAGADQAP